jgi:tRNA1(Val) A37 N6-methylase TrmN6
LSLIKANPLVHVTGLEIQKNYLDLAIKNAVLNEFASRFSGIECDLGAINTIIPPDSFDFVITNPPFYVASSGRLSPDMGKKIAHHGTIDLIQWIRKSLYPLRNGGLLTIICRTDRLGDIYMALHNRAGNIHIKPIITGNANHAKRIILSCQKAAKGGTKIVFP